MRGGGAQRAVERLQAGQGLLAREIHRRTFTSKGFP
jgi:hypothetical protein